MIPVVYSSVAVQAFSSEQLVHLLSRARVRNHERGVTGQLLYRNGRFLQVLEGPAAEVDALINTIQADRRHTGFRVLLREEISEREFADWSMGSRTWTRRPRRACPG